MTLKKYLDCNDLKGLTGLIACESECKKYLDCNDLNGLTWLIARNWYVGQVGKRKKLQLAGKQFFAIRNADLEKPKQHFI